MISSETMQVLVIGTGAVATLLPLYYGLKFVRDVHGFGFVLALMLFGESLAMGITLEFGLNTYFGFYESLTDVQLFFRRMTIFIGCLTTTAILGYNYNKWKRKFDEEHKQQKV